MKKQKLKNTPFRIIIMVLVTSVSVFCLGVQVSQAAVANLVNYQGKLTDTSGWAVADGDYDMRFKLYDAATDGSLLWTGTHTAANGNAVTTSRGIFSILLGSGTGNTLIDFTSDTYYLQVEIYNSNTAGWEIFNNRKRIGAVPQALNALEVVGNGYINIDATATAQDALNISYNPASGAYNAATVSYGSGGGTGTALSVIQEGTGNALTVSDVAGDTTPFVIDGSGNVGIGDATPDAPLEILSTSPQLLLSYTDGSVNGIIGVDSAESLVFQAGTAAETKIVQIGVGGVGSATPDFFALDVKSDTGDPVGGFEGAMYYNTFDNKFRCYQNSAWTDCIGSGSATDFQTTYGNDANGSNTTISLTADDDGLVITNPTSGGNDLSAFTMQVSQLNTTAAITTLDLVQASNAANGVDITANAIDGETGLSITTDGLTSGKGLSVTSSSTAFTGSLAGISLTGSDAANTGNVLAVSNTGVANTNVTLFVDHRATGTNNLAVRVDDVSGDTTPFVIDGTGKVGIGTTAPARALDIVEAASAAQLRLSKDLTNYSEFTVDSGGDLQIGATGTDIKALSENLWICDGDACPALTLTGDGNIFVENVLKFGNGVYVKNDSATELGVYDNDDNAMLIFDEL